MIRRIIHIDSEKCDGCGACAEACHEGAIGMVDGKAKLLREDYCDGLGDCLPTCPADAIHFEEREAPAYDAAAVARAKLQSPAPADGGCPGSVPSRLSQWPVQIKLVPVNAPWLRGCDLLIAADCTAYAFGDFHERFIRGRITLVGCPKLDGVDYSEKLTQILADGDIRSITVTRMEVPCCGGLEFAVKRAIARSGKSVPLSVVTISADGKILDE